MFTVSASVSAAPPSQAASSNANQSHSPSHGHGHVFEVTAALQARWIAGNVERLFGAEKRDTVERLLATVCSVEQARGTDGHTLSLESFCALSDLAKRSRAVHFSVAMAITLKRTDDHTRREVLTYQFEVDNTVIAYRTLASAPRESMLRFVRKIESLQLPLPDDAARSYCFADAQIINRLVNAFPDAVGLQTSAEIDALAADIDDLNTIPDYCDDPHIVMAAKAMMLADYFPGQRFDIHFRREMGIDDDGYFLCVRPKIDQASAIASASVELYAGEIAPGDSRQILSLLLLAIRLRVDNELDEHHVSIDSCNALIAKHRDAMTQDPATRRMLVERGDDPNFHHANYRFLSADANEGTFSVAFNDQVMVFSNATPTMRELRGERLQKLLKHGHYRNLDELMATGHRTATDPILRAAMSTLQNDVLPMMLRVDPDGLRMLSKEIDLIPVADTTLGALWDPIRPYSVSQAQAQAQAGIAASAGAFNQSPAALLGPAGSAPVHAAAPALFSAPFSAPFPDHAQASAPVHSAAQAALRASLRVDVFAPPIYGASGAGEALPENPAPEGVSRLLFDRLPGRPNWI